jgi:hypothetical protein
MDTIEFKPTNYPSDLSDGEWEEIAEYFPQGPNSEHHKRSLINAVLCIWWTMVANVASLAA